MRGPAIPGADQLLVLLVVAEEGSFAGTAKLPWTRHLRDVRYENTTGVGGLVNNGEVLKNFAVAGLESAHEAEMDGPSPSQSLIVVESYIFLVESSRSPRTIVLFDVLGMTAADVRMRGAVSRAATRMRLNEPKIFVRTP
jgi:hypothetical protein